MKLGTGHSRGGNRLSKMMTPKDKTGHVVNLSDLMTDARDLSSCCVGVEANLDVLADPARQKEVYSERRSKMSFGFSNLIKSG